MPHYEITSPLAEPITYLLFVITWTSCLVSVWLSLYFYRTKNEGWWLLIALATGIPLLFELTICLWHGLPPLPYHLTYPSQVQHAPPPNLENPDGLSSTETIVTYSASRVQWSFYPPLMAAALLWAYCADKKKRAQQPSA